MKKICGTCKQEKDISCFTVNKTKRDGYQSYCKECRKVYIRQHYLDNKQYYLDKAKDTRDSVISWFKEYKKTLVCSKCGFDNPAALDFHHPNSDKEFTISRMVRNQSKQRLLKEIKKCTVLCANCHRILHSK